MPRIRVLQSVGGLDFSWVPGDIVDLPAEEAAKWADGYRAEYVRGDKPERAVAPKPETAAAPKPRTRKSVAPTHSE